VVATGVVEITTGTVVVVVGVAVVVVAVVEATAGVVDIDVVVVLTVPEVTVMETTILAHSEPSVRIFGDESASAPNSVGPCEMSNAAPFSE
jgi:hypothetical protein